MEVAQLPTEGAATASSAMTEQLPRLIGNSFVPHKYED